MSHGQKKAEIDPTYRRRIEDLEKKAENASKHFRTHSDWREWHIPDGVKDPLYVPALHEPNWNRDKLNYTYSEKVNKQVSEDSGTYGDGLALKWQIDFMAVEERAFRTRHASMIRCAAFAHGRLDGHGKKDKSIFSFCRQGSQSAIDFGAISE